MRLEQLKSKIDNITTNIAIYKRDLEKYNRQLVSVFGLKDIKKADELIGELDGKIRSLKKRESRVIKEATELLKKAE